MVRDLDYIRPNRNDTLSRYPEGFGPNGCRAIRSLKQQWLRRRGAKSL